MPEFNLAGLVTVSCLTKVKANTLEEAIAIAKKRGMAEFHIDGTYPVNECWHLDSDGTPYDIREEK